MLLGKSEGVSEQENVSHSGERKSVNYPDVLSGIIRCHISIVIPIYLSKCAAIIPLLLSFVFFLPLSYNDGWCLKVQIDQLTLVWWKILKLLV